MGTTSFYIINKDAGKMMWHQKNIEKMLGLYIQNICAMKKHQVA